MGIRTERIAMSLIAAAVLVAAVACQQPAPATPPPSPDYAAELGPAIDTFIGVWNDRRYDELDAVVSPSFRRIAPDANAEGVAGLKDFMRQVHAAYPDFRIVVNEAHYLPDLAVLIWTVTATVDDKPLEVTGATFNRFADGMIVEEQVFYDTATITEQLGIEQVPHAE